MSKQITISDIEPFINTDEFNPEYCSWNQSNCSLVGIIRVLMIQEIEREHKDPSRQNEYQEWLDGLLNKRVKIMGHDVNKQLVAEFKQLNEFTAIEKTIWPKMYRTFTSFYLKEYSQYRHMWE